jgi:hypothetical protein
MRKLAALAVVLLSACGEQRPAAPTAEQSDQLNEAEGMLNELAKEEGPEAQAPDPSNSTD